MAPRPRVSARVADGIKRTKELLVELRTHGPMSALIYGARGDMAFVRAQAEKGFVHVTPDSVSLLPAGREWLKQYG